jgi:AraC-like DNA-binding protein
MPQLATCGNQPFPYFLDGENSFMLHYLWAGSISAIHGSVNTPWTVESLAEAAGMSRSAFAARFKGLLGQTPLEYVTEWRMQKAMQLLEQRDKKMIDVARLVGYESDAAFSKAFKRVVGEYIKRGFEGHGHAGMAEDF